VSPSLSVSEFDEIWQLARSSDPPVSASDPVGDQDAVLLGRLLPCEVTGVERMDLADREEVVQELVRRTEVPDTSEPKALRVG
jgi:hypothetical protein